MPRPAILFVYGTLKRGGPLHGHLGASPFLGIAQTQPIYTLLDMGAYPGLIQGGNTTVWGELFQVAPDLWNHLDDIEGAPDLFYRKAISLSDPRFQPDAYFLTNPPVFSKTIPGGKYLFS